MAGALFMANKKLNEQLIESIEKNNLKKVRYILRLGGEANYRKNYWPAVFYAKSDEMYDLLVEYGAKVEDSDVNKVSRLGKKILAETGSPKLARRLIEMGEDVNGTSNLGWNVLVYAQNDDVADVIIENGGRIFDKYDRDAKSRDRNGGTALMQANCMRIFDMLCDMGANINATDVDGDSILHYIVRNKNIDMAKKIVKKNVDIDVKGMRGETPLMWACMYDDLEMVSLLIENGADVNAKNRDSETVIFKAFDYKILKKLVESGADIEAKNALSDRILHKVIDRGDIKSFEYLIERKADINAKNFSGFTPLMRAVISENEEMVRRLIELGANVGDRNSYGYDALKLASSEMKKVIVEECKKKELKSGKVLTLKAMHNALKRH